LGQVGELLVSGVGLFSGYLGREDLNEKALVKINDHIYYRTGDLVRLDNNGLIYYMGRKDHQIKLRGQRIELGEIESVIMRSSDDITNCLVVKIEHNNVDHLIAYVQTKTDKVHRLRENCLKELPLYMVPSYFICIDRFPLNKNGKLDREALPKHDWSQIFTSLKSRSSLEQSLTDIEQQIMSIWCNLLHIDSIPSIETNFFQLGGNSLVLMRLQHIYQQQFKKSLDIRDLFRLSTITDHAYLIEIKQQPTSLSIWPSLNIMKG